MGFFFDQTKSHSVFLLLALHVIRWFQNSFSVKNTSLEEYFAILFSALHANLDTFSSQNYFGN